MERYLIHSAKGSTWSKKDHKYISRKKVNGKWVYTYNNPESRNYRQDQMMNLSTREMYTKSKSPQYKDELGMYDNIDDLIDALKTKRRNNAELISKASGITSKHTYSDNVKKYDQAIKEANDIKKEEEDLAKNPTILKKLKHIRHSDNTVYLVHHGILGQKWGIRRFQNPDGTLTELGRKRIYGEGAKYGGNESFRHRNRRAINAAKYEKDIKRNQRKLDRAYKRGNEKKINKYENIDKKLNINREIMSKDLSPEMIQMGRDYLKEMYAFVLGGVGPGVAITLSARENTNKVYKQEAERQKMIKDSEKAYKRLSEQGKWKEASDEWYNRNERIEAINKENNRRRNTDYDLRKTSTYKKISR